METMSTETKATDSMAPGFKKAEAIDTGVSKKTIAVSPAAVEAVRMQLKKRGTPEGAIRVGIRGGGCTGFTYVFEWADQPRPTDKLIEAYGVKVVVDPKSFVYLRGMQLDFVRGMMGHGFKFNNPNAKGACGCGESVQF
jgi:iron-sulfur cluster assembly protein